MAIVFYMLFNVKNFNFRYFMNLNKIIKLIKTNDEKVIYKKLNSLPIKSKGLSFELFLVELFKGNGWHVIHSGKRNDFGADLLVYKNFTQSSPSFIVQAKNISRAMTFDQTKIELIKFEDLASIKYKCRNYLIYSLNGYSQSSKKLEKFNVSLNDSSDIFKLVESYSQDNYGKKSSVLLAPHNKVTYEKIKKISKKVSRFAVVQATGTGKSYLISSQLNDSSENGPSLFVAPSNVILEKQKEKNPWLNNVVYKTYQQLMEDNQSERLEDNYSLIILDELHRSGAKKWQTSIERLLELNTKALFCGYSATPIRYLDRGRNMCEELFDGNIINGPDLAEAIARNILKRPHYITAAYDTEERLIKKFNHNSELLKSAIANWCGHTAIEKVINNHPIKNGQKYIVFCENQKSMKMLKVQMEYAIKVSSIKNNLEVDINILEVGYRNGHKKNNDIILEFEKKENNIKLLFCVNILNEGLHVNDISGIFLFRRTISANIYLQQIGRAVSVGSNINPIIFDFVQNCENISELSLNRDIDEARRKMNKKRNQVNLKDIFLLNNIITKDYTKNFFDIIEKLKDNSEPWNIKFNQLKDYYLKIGNTNISQRSSTLGKFVSRNRDSYKNNTLSRSRIEKLNEINFNFNLLGEKWLSDFNYCLSLSQSNGIFPVLAEDKRSKRFYDSMRRQNRKDSVNIERKFKLDSHGFVWNVLEYDWAEKLINISLLSDYGEDLKSYCIKKSTIGKWIYRHKEKTKKLNFNFNF
jgi:superfamily II DNA or RNA helicase